MKNAELSNKKGSNFDKTTKDVKPKLCNFGEGQDDRNEILHTASMLRLPICSPANYWTLLPKKRTSIYKALPFGFLGCANSLAEKTIAAAHDRTIPQQLKHYLVDNANIQNKPKREIRQLSEDGVCSIVDDWWTEVPSTLNAVQEAISSHDCLSFFLWPQDPTPKIINRLMIKYRWISAATSDMTRRITVITAFFNGILAENASRAINDLVVMSYDEAEQLLKGVMQRNGLRGELPFIEKKSSDDYTKPSLQPQKQGLGQAQQRKSKGPQPRKSLSDSRTKAGSTICYHFNGQRPCRNVAVTLPSGEPGCRDQRGMYAHSCNVYMVSKQAICESNQHGRHQHK